MNQSMRLGTYADLDRTEGSSSSDSSSRADELTSKSKVQVSTKAMLSCFWVILLGPLPEVQRTIHRTILTDK